MRGQLLKPRPHRFEPRPEALAVSGSQFRDKNRSNERKSIRIRWDNSSASIARSPVEFLRLKIENNVVERAVEAGMPARLFWLEVGRMRGAYSVTPIGSTASDVGREVGQSTVEPRRR